MFGNLGLALLIAVAISTLDSPSEACTDYCNVKTCKGKPHTLCLYPSYRPAKRCNQYTYQPLSYEEQKALLKKHNDYRAKIARGQEKRGKPGPQPEASNMRELVWDSELALVAQRWADQCTSAGHDKCRNVGRFRVGQNIITEWNRKNITHAIEVLVDLWTDEVELFNKKNVKSYVHSKPVGHYTQLVWADSKYMGCARSMSWDSSLKKNKLKLVCNYGPTGNILKKPLYQIGKAATKCEHGKSRIRGLCK